MLEGGGRPLRRRRRAACPVLCLYVHAKVANLTEPSGAVWRHTLLRVLLACPCYRGRRLPITKETTTSRRARGGSEQRPRSLEQSHRVYGEMVFIVFGNAAPADPRAIAVTMRFSYKAEQRSNSTAAMRCAYLTDRTRLMHFILSHRPFK